MLRPYSNIPAPVDGAMLTELRVRDLAVIADVTLPFQPGLNVLTGETGAGKSMVVDALALLLGERASADVVRPGAEKTIVEGAFEFGSSVHRHLLSPFAELGVELEEGRLVLKREVHREGKSRAWVNGSPTTIGVLAQIGALLVDLHGQHETQSLLRPEAQRDMLDAYADADVERVAVRDAHGRLKELEQREAQLAERQAEVRKKADYLRHVLQEIERAKPKVGEDEALEVEAKRLAHAEELGHLARDLEEVVDAAGLTAAHELELLDTADLDLRNIGAERERAAAEFTRATEALTAKRIAGAKKLARAVNKILPSLGMTGGRFGANLSVLSSPMGFGAESVTFDVELSEGMGRRALARVASGGELSRLMLALKVVLAAHAVVPTLVFDEVDQGIGGEVGGRVGEALLDVSREGRQALVITHLPQIAVYADQHLRVAKGKKGGVATSDVEVVKGEERTKEIAWMLGDADMATARRHAVELLKTASEKFAAESGRPTPPARAHPAR